MSVQARPIHARHSGLLPCMPAGRQPGGSGLTSGQIEYWSSWFTNARKTVASSVSSRSIALSRRISNAHVAALAHGDVGSLRGQRSREAISRIQGPQSVSRAQARIPLDAQQPGRLAGSQRHVDARERPRQSIPDGLEKGFFPSPPFEKGPLPPGLREGLELGPLRG